MMQPLQIVISHLLNNEKFISWLVLFQPICDNIDFGG